MLLRHRKNEWKQHKYKDLSWMVGDEFDVQTHGLTQGYMPESVVMIAEYPDTILLELVFQHGTYKRMIGKNLLVCGDIFLRHKATGIILTGSEVMESYDDEQATWYCF